MYHHVGKAGDESSGSFFIDEETFAQQLDVITKNYHPITLSELEDCYMNKKEIPRNAVLLTFDDGYLDNYTYAYPLVLRKRVPITIFLSTSEVGTAENILTWEQVKEMYDSKLVEFSSHGANHKRLRKCSDADVVFELTNSKEILEGMVGKPVRSFCYPYGAFDKRVRRLMFKAGYIMDFGTRKGINSWPWKCRRPLLRAHVMRNDTVKDFQRQLVTGYKKGIRTWLCR
jgi:peptidoglycan/xylan/chitin deacetylase (PgdA/CDA1 family)